MNRIRLSSSAALVLAVLATPLPALAQSETVQPTNPDADLLAAEMRSLAANPRDLRALLSAAEISTRLDDTSAALAFYARAEAVEPGNPRILAGRAAVLVRLERPGEALRLFQQAEQRGLAMADYASDRGFAYDLLGAPQLAQRDYRTALLRNPRDDETTRRLALSLGIIGRADEAMAALDPLLRRSDRAAWRARAFILAMNGDVAGAERISTSMMPGNMGAAMTPFFRRLSNLSVADRAYAVHFGELSPTQARRTDAQFAPPLPAYVPDRPPVAVAAATPQPRVVSPPLNQGRDRRSRRERERDQLAAASAAAARPAPQVAQTPPLPAPPAFQPPSQAIVQPTPLPTPIPAPVRYAAHPVPAPTPPVRTVSQLGTIPSPTRSGTPASIAPALAPVRVASAPIPVRVVSQPAAVPETEGDADLGPTTLAPAVTRSAPPAASAPVERPAPAPTRVGAEDSELASIMNGITIPASELGVAPLSGETRAEAAAQPVRTPASEAPRPAPKPAPKAEAPTPAARPATKPGTKPAVSATATDARGKKKAEAPKPKPKPPAEPARIWVQVAGGANETTLSTAWKKLIKQAPAAFRGRTPWTTPLRATNRVLTGPFKTAADAQAFVNALKKEDISAFVFTSEEGQKITKLEVK